MAYVVVRRCLIGEWREPGYVCSSEDLRGRNVRHMEDVDRCVRYDPSVPEPAPSSGGEGDGGEDLSSLSLKDLKARAVEAGVERAEGLKSKAAVIEAIQATLASTDEGGEGDDEPSEDESSGED